MSFDFWNEEPLLDKRRRDIYKNVTHKKIWQIQQYVTLTKRCDTRHKKTWQTRGFDKNKKIWQTQYDVAHTQEAVTDTKTWHIQEDTDNKTCQTIKKHHMPDQLTLKCQGFEVFECERYYIYCAAPPTILCLDNLCNPRTNILNNVVQFG